MNPTNEQELEQILEGMYHAAHTDGLNDVFRPEPKVERYKQLINAHTNAEIAKTLKTILKSYPKKNRTMNDTSKLTRADIDRMITELKEG